MNTVVNEMRKVTAKIEDSLGQVNTDWETKIEEHNKLIEEINQDVEAFEEERDGYLVNLHTDFGFASRKELIKALRGIEKVEKAVLEPVKPLDTVGEAGSGEGDTEDTPDSETSDQEETETDIPL